MRRLFAIFALLALLITAPAYADEHGEAEEETTQAPLPILALAEYYELDVEEVQSLHEAGIGYGLLFRLLALVEAGEVTTEELLEWRTERPAQGWGVLLRLARDERVQGANLGQAMKSYVQSRRAGDDDDGSETAATGPEAKPSKEEKAKGNGNGQGNGNGNGQGNGNGNGNGQGNGGNPPGQAKGKGPKK